MKQIIFVFTLINFFQVALSQGTKGLVELSSIPPPVKHYMPEYTFDIPVDSSRWLDQAEGTHFSFASTNESYFRTEVPDLKKEISSWQGTGWRGERLNALILVWSPDTLKQIRFNINHLTDSKGHVLNKNNLKLNLVRYVLSNYPYAEKASSCDISAAKNVYLLPDRLEPFDRFEIPGRTVRPVWLSIEIPSNAEPGVYHGNLELKTENSNNVLSLELKVQRLILPKPHEWKYRLDLWQNPWVVARYNHLQPWSEEHKELLRKHLKLYADAGGKYITTYAVHSPWADNSHTIEETMIEWIKLKNDSWKFDYNVFDQYVQLAMEAGIDNAITIYTPVPWENRFRYLDEKTGNYIYESWPPESKEFKDIWNIFLTDLRSHLEKKGWLEKTFLGINENPMSQTLATIKVIKDHSKKWKITYAGDWHQELNQLLNDYCFLYGNEASIDQVRDRSAKGFTTTYYVACGPSQPNNFVFSPPVESRWISWYSSAHGYDGFLRWAYDAWPDNPLRDARHVFWPAGDCFLVYPAANSSVRFEKLREGIIDYEKIRILKQLVSKSTDKKLKQMMQEFQQHLNSFNNEKNFDPKKLADDINKGEKMIENITENIAR